MRLEEHSERAEGQLSVLKLFTFRSLRWQLLSIIIMNMGQQLSGVNAVSHATLTANHSEHHSFLLHLSMPSLNACQYGFVEDSLICDFTEVESQVYLQIYYYADSIFSSAGVKDDHIQYVTVGTGTVNVLMTFAAVSVLVKP